MLVDLDRCLTRVVIDDAGVEVAQLQSVMRRIQQSLRGIPGEQRDYVASALLALAVSHLTQADTR
jgi:hypothetical protein